MPIATTRDAPAISHRFHSAAGEATASSPGPGLGVTITITLPLANNTENPPRTPLSETSSISR